MTAAQQELLLKVQKSAAEIGVQIIYTQTKQNERHSDPQIQG
jgi:hypothetical protein